MSDDRYDTTLQVDGDDYRISFLPMLQMIVFTNMNQTFGGEFRVKFGWISTKKPSNFLLEAELKHHLKTLN
jgi:hypothetical protein